MPQEAALSAMNAVESVATDRADDAFAVTPAEGNSKVPAAVRSSTASRTSNDSGETEGADHSLCAIRDPELREAHKQIYHEWWQSQTHVIVNIVSDEIRHSGDSETEGLHMSATFGEMRATLHVPQLSGYRLSLQLAHPVIPSKCKATKTHGKISLQLRKQAPVPWDAVEQGEADSPQPRRAASGCREDVISNGGQADTETTSLERLEVKAQAAEAEGSMQQEGQVLAESHVKGMSTANDRARRSAEREEIVSASAACRSEHAQPVSESLAQALESESSSQHDPNLCNGQSEAVERALNARLGANGGVTPSSRVARSEGAAAVPQVAALAYMLSDPLLSAEDIAMSLLKAEPAHLQPVEQPATLHDLVELATRQSFAAEFVPKVQESDCAATDVEYVANILICATADCAEPLVNALLVKAVGRKENEQVERLLPASRDIDSMEPPTLIGETSNQCIESLSAVSDPESGDDKQPHASEREENERNPSRAVASAASDHSELQQHDVGDSSPFGTCDGLHSEDKPDLEEPSPARCTALLPVW